MPAFEKSKSVVVIWSEGYPYKLSASNTKNYLLGKSFIHAGYYVFLTSKLPFRKNGKNAGTFKGVQYINFQKYNENISILAYLKALIKECLFLKKLKKKYGRVYLVTSYVPFLIYLIYYPFCKINKIKIVLNIMEWHIAVYKNSSLLKKINAFLFDNMAVLLADGAIVISDYIYKELRKKNQPKPLIKIPILTDLEKIDKVQKDMFKEYPYLLYCGGIEYDEIIDKIIKGYDKYIGSETSLKCHLIMIVNGKNDKIEKLSSLSAANYSNVHILSNLNFDDLIRHISNAELLFAPLRNNAQDEARYPQKIAEYSACIKPIISNSIGQVGIDFSHKNNIYFAEDISEGSIAKAIREILNNKLLSLRISSNARKKCESLFDYKIYSEKLNKFLSYLDN